MAAAIIVPVARPAAGSHEMPRAYRALEALPADSANAGKSFFDMPAEQVFKNIVIFKGKTAGEVLGAMRFINVALGVNCEFCHVHEDFSKDDKAPKLMARSMYYMTQKINNQDFSVPTVTCYTCHNGHQRPLSDPLLGGDRTGGESTSGVAIKPAPAGVTLDQVLDAYTKALGGQRAIAAVRTRVAKGTETHADGRTGPIEISYRGPDQAVVATGVEKPSKGTMTQVFNGTGGWSSFNGGEPRDLVAESVEQARRASELIPAATLRSMYPDIAGWGREQKLSVWGRDQKDGHDYVVVGGAMANGSRERLYFDASTGLLARRYVEYRSILGYLPFTIEYSDYRDVDGVKVPYTIRWQTTRDTWTDSFSEIRNNVPVDDALFQKPQGGAKK
jgi:hypothetical protein